MNILFHFISYATFICPCVLCSVLNTSSKVRSMPGIAVTVTTAPTARSSCTCRSFVETCQPGYRGSPSSGMVIMGCRESGSTQRSGTVPTSCPRSSVGTWTRTNSGNASTSRNMLQPHSAQNFRWQVGLVPKLAILPAPLSPENWPDQQQRSTPGHRRRYRCTGSNGSRWDARCIRIALA